MSGNLLATGRAIDAREGWAETLGSFEEVLERYPATEANATALELERHAAALGIRLAPRNTDRAPADRQAGDPLKQLKRNALSKYPDAQLGRARRGDLDPAPPDLLEYIDTHAETLAALAAALDADEIPVWESDLSQLAAAPIPNLLGQMDLHKLLNAIALARLAEGDRDGALRAVETSWRLARSLRDSPVMICQLIYLAATRLQVGALRHVPDLSEAWIRRLREHDFRASFLTALKFEGWHWAYVDPRDMMTPGPHSGMVERLAAPVVGPYARLCLADLSDTWRERTEIVEGVTTLCDRDLRAEGAGMDVDLPFWNVLGRNYAPNLLGAVDRVARLEVDLELLALAAEADARQRATGVWPGDQDGSGSQACPADRWLYRPRGSGIEIALSRDLDWPRLTFGADIPQRIEIE